MPVKSAAAMAVTDDQRARLERMASSTSLPHRQVVQARALLWACDGVANEEIARRCGVDSDTVRRWRFRFAEQGVAGVGRSGSQQCLCLRRFDRLDLDGFKSVLHLLAANWPCGHRRRTHRRSTQIATEADRRGNAYTVPTGT